MTVLIGNYINVMPGQPAFNIMSNYTDYFRIGHAAGDDLWLEGKIVDGEHIFNGRLYLPDGSFGTLIDSFPKGPVDQTGWQQVRRFDVEGYRLVRGDGELIFSFRVDQELCSVDVDLFSKEGKRVAHAGQGGLVIDFHAKLGSRGGFTIE